MPDKPGENSRAVNERASHSHCLDPLQSSVPQPTAKQREGSTKAREAGQEMQLNQKGVPAPPSALFGVV